MFKNDATTVAAMEVEIVELQARIAELEAEIAELRDSEPEEEPPNPSVITIDYAAHMFHDWMRSKDVLDSAHDVCWCAAPSGYRNELLEALRPTDADGD